MPPFTPGGEVGTRSSSGTMVVVICPTCKQKRWANIDQHAWKKARTTCCGTVVDVPEKKGAAGG